MTIEAARPVTDQPLHKAAQRLRWFVAAFEGQVARISAETGNTYSVNQTLLAEVFSEWFRSFNAQKPGDSADNPAYVGFAAGLMLRTLVRKAPVRHVASPAGADRTNPAYFWPEGYLYVAFCLNVRGLVLETDYNGHQHPGQELGDMRTWWSFRENVEQDATLAIAFLDLFAGDEPEWTTPELFRPDRTHGIAGRFFRNEAVGQVERKP